MDLTPEQRRRLRQCKSPHAAHRVLADIAAISRREGNGLSTRHALPPVPATLLEDLRRHTQAAHSRAMDLEEELEKQAAAHRAELEAMREEHHKVCKRAK